MKRKLINFIYFVGSFLIIYACLMLGKLVSSHLPFVFPGSIIGLILMFLCLQFNIIKLNWIMPSGSILLKYMALTFMPVAVGIICYLDEVYSSIALIMLNIFVGVILIILVVGRLFQHLSESPEERKWRKDIYSRHRRLKHHQIKKSIN